MTSKVTKSCKSCKKEMQVRVADVRRGWGKFCSKSCKAKDQVKKSGYQFRKVEVFSYGDDLHPFDIDQ